MPNYEKPVVLLDENLSEGIYAASGAGSTTRTCQSQYMNGNYRALVRHDGDSDVNHKKSERGCEGCNADWNNGHCNVSSCNYDGTFKPAWEAAGFGPDDQW